MTNYEKVLSELSVKPIQNLEIQLQKPMLIQVVYDHGIITHKMDLNLQTFLFITQHVKIRKVALPIEECIECPLLYYDLLGFQVGDTAIFENEEQLFIRFS